MKAALWINHTLITLFAICSGTFKALGGQADLDVFAHLQMGAVAVALFGAIQAFGGLGLLFARTCRPAAAVVALCNALATIGLFAAGLIPFALVSILFVVMAVFELNLGGDGVIARPRIAQAAL